ncbi:hypothetical protein IWZ03DRAFT_360601 [Phyllosticta citriasiana]|uniref:BTB domain-containing protein n=1 Tax=Phyllosticta citriasiana TaxID=595635 RepID=A0ABR1KI49_9PEZI
MEHSDCPDGIFVRRSADIELLKSDLYADVKIQVGKTVFKAHKAVEAHINITTLEEPANPAVVRAVLGFLTTATTQPPTTPRRNSGSKLVSAPQQKCFLTWVCWAVLWMQHLERLWGGR